MRKQRILMTCFYSEIIVTLISMLRDNSINLQIVAGFINSGEETIMPTSGVEWLRHGDEANFDNEVVRTVDAIVNMLDCQNAAEIAELAIHYKKPLIVSDSILNSSCLAVYQNAAKHVPVLQCSSSHLKIAADSMREIARFVEELAHEKPDGKIHELQKS